jgi:hypothetical protein
MRVDGWLYEPTGKTWAQAVRFLDAGGKQVGYALGGKARDDVAGVAGKEARLAGFRGYLSTAQFGSAVILRGEGPAGPFCQLQLKMPSPPPFTTALEVPSAERATLSSSNVTERNGWMGADYFKSSFPGMSVFGSFKDSDADRGAIALRVKRGDRLFYRSGPSVTQQIIEINGSWTVALPLATDWVRVEFTSDALPQEPFTVRLMDNGSGWGEWSAIALKSN